MSLYHKIKRKIYPPDQAPPSFIPQFRLEGRTRHADNERGLAMRTADPLWMLGRQWQFAEFQAEDNGSPIRVKVNFRKEEASFYSFRNSNYRQALDQTPLEAKVEAIEVVPKSLQAKVRIGQKYEALIEAAFSTQQATRFIEDLRSEFPLNKTGPLDEKSRRFFKLMAGNVIDGGTLWQNILENKFPYGDFNQLDAITEQLKSWYRELFHPASANTAWDASQLVHQVKLHHKASEAPDDFTLRAPDYQSGQLDWYSFDNATVGLNPTSNTEEVDDLIPINASFASMPDKRLFSFEDSKLDITEMELEVADLVRLMLIDFSLVSGSDWYTIPLEMKPGELCWINQLEVQDVFGVKTLINNSPSTNKFLSKNGLNTWDVFKIRDKNVDVFNPPDHFLFLAPAATFRLESKPLEELLFLRDEYANMVWAIEKTVCNQLGKPTNGYDLHLELQDPLEVPPEAEREATAMPRFRLASPVAPNWIPYLPLHIEGSHTNIELQRAIMMRNEATRAPEDILPLSSLAREDILKIREEAIPRAGVRVQLTKQRVRWTDGKTYIWLGRKVLAGTGEGNSGLTFDQLLV